MFLIMGKKKRKQNNKKTKNKKECDDFEEESMKVEGLKKCPHMNKAAKLGVLQNHVAHAKLGQCSFCEDHAEDTGVCICLRCAKQGCDRYSTKQHGLAHYNDSPSHSITLHLQSLLVWCYSCDMEVSIFPNTDLDECVKLILKRLKLDAPNDQKFHIPKLMNSTKKSDVCNTDNTNRKVKGLVNLGNTCFFNAVMQNLNQTELLHIAMNFVSQAQYSQKVFDKNNKHKLTVQVTNPAGSLTVSLNKLLGDFRLSAPGPLSPKFLFSEICKKAPRFKGFRQQDSQELLRYLLDSLKTEQLKRIKAGDLKLEVDEEADSKNLPDEKDQSKLIKEYDDLIAAPSVDSVFSGKLDSIVVCQRCHTESRVKESFLDLSLSLAKPQEPKVKPKAKKGSVFGKKKDNIEESSETAVNTADKSPKPSKHQQKAAKEAKRKKGKRKGRARTSSRSISEDDPPLETEESENHSDNENAADDTEIREQNELPEEVPEELDEDDSQQETNKNKTSGPKVEETLEVESTLEEVMTKSIEDNKNLILHREHQGSNNEKHLTKYDTNTQMDESISGKEVIGSDVIPNGMPEKSNDIQNSVIAQPTQIESNDIHNDTICNSTQHGTSEVQSKPEEKETNEVENDVTSIPKSQKTKDVNDGNKDVHALNIKTNNSNIETSGTEKPATKGHHTGLEFEEVCTNQAPKSRNLNVEEARKTSSDIDGKDFLATEIQKLNIEDEISENVKDKESSNTLLLKTNEREVKTNEREVDGSTATAKMVNLGEKDGGALNNLMEEEPTPEITDTLDENLCREESNSEETLKNKKNNSASKTEDIAANSTAENTKCEINDDVMSEKENSSNSPRVLTIGPHYKPNEDECSIQSCLSQFCSQEVLDGRNKFACEECSKRNHKSSDEDEDDGSSEGATASKPARTIILTEATKQLLISSTPPVLTLHLKRFQQVGFGLRKIAKHVVFPLVLDVAPFCSRGEEISEDSNNLVLYSLIGVVEHSGGLNSGHYTACVKLKNKPTYRQPSSITDLSSFIKDLWRKKEESSYEHEKPGDGQWYYVSDSRVTKVTEEKVLKTQAYMLFYERLPLTKKM